MKNLRALDIGKAPVSVRALARAAGISGPVSLLALMRLLPSAKHGPRPFYVIGHNTNSSEEVFGTLALGANALEIDITAFGSRPNELCVAHRGLTGDGTGNDGDPPLVDFLQFLRTQADALPEQLALLVLDVKSPAATAALGEVLLNATRKHLVDDANPINVIVSTASLANKAVFNRIASKLRPREGLMIDEEDNPNDIETLFKTTLGLRPQCYGNGSSFFSETALALRGPVTDACWMRAQRAGFHFVYAWTVNDRAGQVEYLNIGVDGMIADVEACGHMVDLVNTTFAGSVRLAKRADNPFLPRNAAYALTVKTGDDGTDAKITFTLHGANGSASTTVDTSWTGRMESQQTNHVVLQAPDLGALSSISVRSDRAGNAPDWFLETIRVESARYGVNKLATFHRDITTTAEQSAPLV